MVASIALWQLVTAVVAEDTWAVVALCRDWASASGRQSHRCATYRPQSSPAPVMLRQRRDPGAEAGAEGVTHPVMPYLVVAVAKAGQEGLRFGDGVSRGPDSRTEGVGLGCIAGYRVEAEDKELGRLRSSVPADSVPSEPGRHRPDTDQTGGAGRWGTRPATTGTAA